MRLISVNRVAINILLWGKFPVEVIDDQWDDHKGRISGAQKKITIIENFIAPTKKTMD
ncbi:MAG: hypothetical protein LBQ43_02575 [Holosporales bacterium]|jgi:hypothetical protein|nr:hypothetical protein [Holosporales bacterium]